MSILDEVDKIINGERLDSYGKPEDVFSFIAEFWTTWLKAKGKLKADVILDDSDVSILMTLFKIARESHSHKRDNIIDAIGYLAIKGDRL